MHIHPSQTEATTPTKEYVSLGAGGGRCPQDVFGEKGKFLLDLTLVLNPKTRTENKPKKHSPTKTFSREEKWTLVPKIDSLHQKAILSLKHYSE